MGGSQAKRLGDDLMRQQKLRFQHWRRYKAGKIKWQTSQTLVRPIREEVRGLLLRGSFSGNPNGSEVRRKISPIAYELTRINR